MERGITQHLESFPTPHITFTAADRIAVSHHDGRNPEESLLVAAINDENLGHTGSNTTLEDTNREIGEELKMEVLV